MRIGMGMTTGMTVAMLVLILVYGQVLIIMAPPITILITLILITLNQDTWLYPPQVINRLLSMALLIMSITGYIIFTPSMVIKQW